MADLHELVVYYKLENEACSDTEGRGNSLHRKVKVVINDHAIDRTKGVVTRRWRAFSSQDQTKMVEGLEGLAKWLKNFEDSWATKWLLAKGINQRQVNQRRGSRRTGELSLSL